MMLGGLCSPHSRFATCVTLNMPVHVLLRKVQGSSFSFIHSWLTCSRLLPRDKLRFYTMSSSSKKLRFESFVGQKSNKNNNKKVSKAKAVTRRYTFISHPLLKCIHEMADKVLFENSDEKNPSNKWVIAKNIGILSAMRAMIRQDAVYHFQIGFGGGQTGSFVISYSTLGIVANVQNHVSNLTASSDWSGLAALFDEFTIDHVTYHLSPISGGFNVANPGMTCIAIDDDGGVSASTLASVGYDLLLGYPTVSLHCPAVQGATLATEANSTGFRPINISYRRPFPPRDHDPVINAPTSGWVDIATPSNYLGSWLVFNSSVTSSNNTNVYQYVFQCTVRMRARR